MHKNNKNNDIAVAGVNSVTCKNIWCDPPAQFLCMHTRHNIPTALRSLLQSFTPAAHPLIPNTHHDIPTQARQLALPDASHHCCISRCLVTAALQQCCSAKLSASSQLCSKDALPHSVQASSSTAWLGHKPVTITGKHHCKQFLLLSKHFLEHFFRFGCLGDFSLLVGEARALGDWSGMLSSLKGATLPTAHLHSTCPSSLHLRTHSARSLSKTCLLCPAVALPDAVQATSRPNSPPPSSQPCSKAAPPNSVQAPSSLARLLCQTQCKLPALQRGWREQAKPNPSPEARRSESSNAAQKANAPKKGVSSVLHATLLCFLR